jgi:hypothetical protein
LTEEKTNRHIEKPIRICTTRQLKGERKHSLSNKWENRGINLSAGCQQSHMFCEKRISQRASKFVSFLFKICQQNMPQFQKVSHNLE